MNANATPRQSRPPHRLTFARAAGIVLAAMLPRLAAATTLPEPALRLSPALAAPAADVAPEERALLRVEYRAAQTRTSEADAVGDILARVRHMNGMIKDIHGLIEALPQTRPATASATATTAQVATPRPAPLPPDDDAAPSADTSLVMRALMASVIVFLFWLLGKRHNYIRTQRRRAAAAAPDAAATPTIIPADDALVVELPPPAPVVITAFEPPRQFKPVEPVAAGPAPMAAAPDTRVPLTFDTLAVPGPAAMPAGAPPHGPAIDPGTDQSLELAEIMVSMGLAHGAAEALTERIRDNPKRALYHWLKLLDVYRRSEMKEEFEHAARDLHQSFNVQPEDWEAKGGGISIEDYPHLAAKLLQLWPTPECEAFLAGLLKDNRGGTRHGFPQSVAEEILLLEKMLDVEAPTAPA